MSDLTHILEHVRAGDLSVEAAAEAITKQEEDLSFARVDLERLRRCGTPEVIYCPGKTADQVTTIMRSLDAADQDVFASRASQEMFDVVQQEFPRASYNAEARLIMLKNSPERPGIGNIAVACAGTSDIPVAEEAALFAENMGGNVTRLYDVGVAGLHRLTSRLDRLRSANVAIVVAGMEGALPSVVGGLVNCPVIAVPTSVGYGTGTGGYAALLAMLNSCAAGITVVNIDNGFGAGVAATLINRLAERVPDARHEDDT